MNQFVEIVFFAMLAGYLIFRLWAVLGRETPEDMERRQKGHFDQEEGEKVDNVIPLPDRNVVRERENPTPNEEFSAGVREGIRQLQGLESSFKVESFLQGARYAYKMIIDAFAQGDKETLKDLLVPEVYQQFSKAIDDRTTNHQEVRVQIETLDKMDIDDIEILNNSAYITVRYRSRQVITTKDKTGEIIDNPAEISVPITDIWTFMRPIGDENPNWLLHTTKTQSYRDM